ncbi:MAG TPA: hypothetical protein VG826_27115 [Pirellulales bacterium]|nr:hypothetical protein [Pirellulales bacterium]
MAIFQIDGARIEPAQQLHSKRLRDHDPERKRHPKRVADSFELIGEMIASLLTLHLITNEELVQRLAAPRFLHHTAENFLGRENELKRLDEVWSDGTHVLSIIAWGGVGKTALLSEWIQTRFIHKNWQDADGKPSPLAYFDWSFYDHGTRATSDEYATRTGNVGDFFEQALSHFGDADGSRPGKGKRLAELVRQQRTLFILDGLEPLQQPLGSPTAGQLLDPDLYDFVTMLAQANPGLCILTSRQALTDLAGLRGAAARKEDLNDLPKAIAVSLLRKMQITGTDQELEEACEKFGCHALSLTLLGRFLFDAHPIFVQRDGESEPVRFGDIRRIDRVRDLRRADELTREERHRTAWKVLEAYETWLTRAKTDGNPRTLAVLRLTGLFDRTATAGCLASLRAEPVIAGLTEAIAGIADDEWNILLLKLERAHLIKLRAEKDEHIAIDAHPLIREYFARQLRETQPEAFKAAHSRLFDHLCKNTPHRPEGVEGLEPLYHAVMHGCLAGRQNNAFNHVYVDRILRGTQNNGFYSTTNLGAIGKDLAAVTAFFDEPWSKVSPNLTEAEPAWLLDRAAFELRALGRLTEALQTMRASAGLETYIREENWWGALQNAAASAINLSELELTMGQLTEAVADARVSIEYADRGGDGFLEFMSLASRTTLADALHQSGQRQEAGELFAEAERMHMVLYPGFEWVTSLQGFQYCDWLLAPAEREAWWASNSQRSSPAATGGAEDRFGAIEARVRNGMGRTINSNRLLDIALGHLTLARVGLIRAILSASQPQSIPISSKAPWPELPDVAAAVNGLHSAGTMDHLPKGLLTASLYHSVRGEHDAGRASLDEAQQIAERGPMPLYLADIHLQRARLFRDKAELAKAADLIRKLGYGRRYDELADAEAAAANWPTSPC